MKKIKGLLLVTMLTLSLSACGAASKMVENAQDSVMSSVGFNGGMMYDAAAPALKATGAANNYRAESITEETAAAPMQLEEGATQVTEPATLERKLIKTVNLSLETTDYDKTILTIKDGVSKFNGYIEQSEARGNKSGSRYANLTVRIPQENLDAFLFDAEGSGSVTYKNENVNDITLQYADTKDHIKTLEIEQERLWVLLEKADTIETIIALEERLSEIRYELESYNTRLKGYDNKVSYSTVYINIDEVKVYTPQEKDNMFTRIKKGLKENTNDLLESIEDFIVWFTTNIPGFLFYGFILTIIVITGKKLTSNKRKGKIEKIIKNVKTDIDEENQTDSNENA